MWLSKDGSERRNTSNQLVAVAIDRDKGSQYALKWAIDNLLQRGQTVVLLHVKVKPSHGFSSHVVINGRQWDQQTKDLFFQFRCFCTRTKDIQCRDIVLEDSEVQKALIEFVTKSAIEILIMGASNKNSFMRFTKNDTPAIVSKGVPDFCSVYIISKGGKISHTRSASRPPPTNSQLRNQIMNQSTSSALSPPPIAKGSERANPFGSPNNGNEDTDFRSPFTRGGRHPHVKSYGDILTDNDLSFVSSGRPSIDRMPYDMSEERRSTSTNRLSTSSDTDYIHDSSQRRSFADTPISSSPPPDVLVTDLENEEINNTTPKEGTEVGVAAAPKDADLSIFKTLKVILSRKLAPTTLLLWMVFLCNAFAYYGLVLLTTQLNNTCNSQAVHNTGSSSVVGIDYKGVFITSFAELPGLIIAGLLIDRLGRKYSMAVMFVVCSAFLFPLIVHQSNTVTTVLMFGARAAIMGTFTIAFIFAPEIYPTSVRNTGFGIASSMARIGGMVSPAVAVILVQGCHKETTILFFAGVVLAAAICVVLIPYETKGRELTDSISSNKHDNISKAVTPTEEGVQQKPPPTLSNTV